MMVRFLFFLIVLIPIYSTPISAAVVYDVDFNTMTVGEPPSTGGPPAAPSGSHGDSGTECTVVSDVGGLTDQPVYMYDDNSEGSTGLFFDLPYAITVGTVVISWQATTQQVERGGEIGFWGGIDATIGWLCFGEDNQFWAAYGDGAEGEIGAYIGAYAVDQALDFTAQLNMDASQWSLSIDGVEVLSSVPFVNQGSPLNVIRFGTHSGEPWGDSQSNAYGFDNFYLEATQTAVEDGSWSGVKVLY